MARKYKRDSAGRFAGGGTAVKTTTGRAGGFANKSFAARVQKGRAARIQRRKVVKRVGGVAMVGLGAAIGARMQKGTTVSGQIAGAVGIGLGAYRAATVVSRKIG